MLEAGNGDDDPTTLRLSKAEAASRQLECAIRLFFAEDDPVSVHTLTCAALQVFSDILLAKGAGGITRNPFLIKEGKFKEWIAAGKKHENFFKHADKDSEDMIDFSGRLTEIYLFEACHLGEIVTQRPTLAIRTFKIWMMKEKPELFVLTPQQREVISGVPNFPKKDFHLAFAEGGGPLWRLMEAAVAPPMPSTPYDLYLSHRGSSSSAHPPGT